MEIKFQSLHEGVCWGKSDRAEVTQLKIKSVVLELIKPTDLDLRRVSSENVPAAKQNEMFKFHYHYRNKFSREIVCTK